MKCHRANFQGFTLIELMLVAAIVGLLAAIAVPKFANLVVRAREAATKGKLGNLRSAFAIYYADTEGLGYTVQRFQSLTYGGKYLDAIPFGDLPRTPHPKVNTVGINVTEGVQWAMWTCTMRGIFVGCLHVDSYGRVWSTW